MSFRFSCFCLFVKELSSGDSGGRRADFTSAVHHQELAAPPFLLTQLNSLPLLRFIGWILQRRGPVLVSLTDTVLVCVRVCVFFNSLQKKPHRSSPHIARRSAALALACVQPARASGTSTFTQSKVRANPRRVLWEENSTATVVTQVPTENIPRLCNAGVHMEQLLPKATPVAPPTSSFQSPSSFLLSFHKSSAPN